MLGSLSTGRYEILIRAYMSYEVSTKRSAFARFGVALLAVVIACLVRAAMNPFVGNRFQFLTFYPVILLSAWYGGFWLVFSTRS